jgi:hypothetical protein
MHAATTTLVAKRIRKNPVPIDAIEPTAQELVIQIRTSPYGGPPPALGLTRGNSKSLPFLRKRECMVSGYLCFSFWVQCAQKGLRADD